MKDKFGFSAVSETLRVDVTILREGLNAIRGLSTQILGNDEASLEDYKTLMMQIEELCHKTLWKEGEAIDAGYVESGWMPNGPQEEIEICDTSSE